MEPLESLEDLVYRSTLDESNCSLQGASHWVSIPVTLAICGVLAVTAVLLAIQTHSRRVVIQSVGVLLQEDPAAPVHGPSAPAVRPAPPAPRPIQQAATPPPAPAPERQAKEAPPPPPDSRQPMVPDAVPRELPKTDLSRLYGSDAVPGATGAAAAAGSVYSTGGGGTGGAPGKIMDLDITQIREKSRPPLPAYPPLARNARIQGNVVVQIVVGRDGVPMSARALEGPVQLRAAAEAYAMAWKFEPYLQNGVPLVSRFSLTVSYRMK